MSVNVFNKVAVRQPSFNRFDLSHDKKLTCDMGELVPVLCMDVLPGDVISINSEPLVRFAPLVSPVMHRINCHLHYFFVPNRLVWDNWEPFISPPDSDSIPPEWPHTMYNGGGPLPINAPGSLLDYLGLPAVLDAVSAPDIPVSVIPFAGYQMIWNEYYRDQNLQEPVDYKVNDGLYTGGFDLVMLRKRSWMHDYFTAALPFAQKGMAVTLPIGNFSDVPLEYVSPQVSAGGVFRNNLTGAVATNNQDLFTGGANSVALNNPPTETVSYDPQGTLIARTSELTTQAATINDLRVAMRTQEFLERQARGGSRYIEQIRMQFGVMSSDSRLQRPEFIGATSGPVQISEVLQTSESSSTPQANMAGHAISGGRGRRFRYRAEEHGYLFCIMSVTPTTAYQQGIPRHFTRPTMFDFAWPVLAHIGEQEVYNKELYALNASPNGTFGYLPRYSEYRFIPSSVSGDFRTSLDFWHLGRIFDSPPALNAEFIECNPSKRIFAVIDPEQDSLWCHVRHNISAMRKLPKYGTPTL